MARTLSGTFHRIILGLAYWLVAGIVITLFGVAAGAITEAYPAKVNVTVTEWVPVANSSTNNAYVAPDGGIYKFIMHTDAGVIEVIVNTTGKWDAPYLGNPSATGPYRATVIESNKTLSFTAPQTGAVANDAGVLDYNGEKKFVVANNDGYVALANFTITGDWYAYVQETHVEERNDTLGELLGIVVNLMGLGVAGLLLFKGARHIGVRV